MALHRFRGRALHSSVGLRGAGDRSLVASCVSCGARVSAWREVLAADALAIARPAIDSSGRPVVRATASDACSVCGASEMKIRVACGRGG